MRMADQIMRRAKQFLAGEPTNPDEWIVGEGDPAARVSLRYQQDVLG
jgi:hypothetical protein